MALGVKVGTFNTGTGTTPVALSSFGFAPKFVLFFGTHLAAAGDSATASTTGQELGVGWAVSATKRSSVCTAVRDGVATTQTGSMLRSDACFSLCTFSGSSIDGLLDVAMDADGFTATPTDAFVQNTLVSYAAFGDADVTNVDAGVLSLGAGAASYSVTGLSFQPTGVMFFMRANNTTADPTAATSAQASIGFAKSSSARGVMGWRQRHNFASGSDTNTIVMTNRCGVTVNTTADTVSEEVDFVSFNSDGFTVAKTVDTTNATKMHWIAWRGPQIAIGTCTTRTDGNDQPVTGVGFTPKWVMLMGGNATATETVPSAGANPMIGWGASASARHAVTFCNPDGNATDDAQISVRTTRIVIKRQRTGANTFSDLTDMDLKTMDSDGFTLDSVTADAQNTMLLYMALGDAAVSGLAMPVLVDSFRQRRS